MAARPGGALPHGQRSIACLSARGRREPAARRRGGAVSDRPDPGHERAVRGVRARHGASSAELVAGRHGAAGAGRRARHLRLLARRRRVLRVGGREAAERGRVGSRGERRRRAPLAVGRRAARPHPGGVRGRHRRARRRRAAACIGSARAGRSTWPGNVAEWVASAYAPYPAVGDDTEPRVVRGGSYIHGARRASLLGAPAPAVRARSTRTSGFRVAADPGAAVAPGLDLVDVPGGSCLIGRDPVEPGGEALADELPGGVVELPAFEISATPVTNAQYAAFVRETGHRQPLHWPGGEPPAGSRRAPRHLGRRRRRGGLLRVARRPPPDRGRVGEGSAR